MAITILELIFSIVGTPKINTEILIASFKRNVSSSENALLAHIDNVDSNVPQFMKVTEVMDADSRVKIKALCGIVTKCLQFNGRIAPSKVLQFLEKNDISKLFTKNNPCKISY